MKKIIFILLGLLLVSFAFCSDCDCCKDTVKPQVEYLFKHGFLENIEEITELSTNLTSAEKYRILYKEEVSPLASFGLSQSIGFGVGSYVYGDKKGGNRGLLLDSCAALTWIINASRTSKYPEKYAEWQSDKYNWGDSSRYKYKNRAEWEAAEPKKPSSAFPIIVTAASRLYQGIRSFKSVKEYNEKLVDALGVYSLETNLAPVLNTDGTLGMSLGVKIGL
ncbi:MAG: hypothetical protein IKZ04_00725 [Spirochaetaceae bacterium]|nr:hypothetical protein [Spirochaetaceae bacterium]